MSLFRGFKGKGKDDRASLLAAAAEEEAERSADEYKDVATLARNVESLKANMKAMLDPVSWNIRSDTLDDVIHRNVSRAKAVVAARTLLEDM